ncbi:hypothetical protein QLS71_007920 [Mariniflexile litorale]|uniref:Type IV leader peptidase family protein n=1 Tax=Mariniflexile litorale TaxID=3045158 RepID=A0AAU7EKC0_9FLAO|nr:hypothetical protein [Mariniflexile sp. KMM 9835]MDQ8213259.1 hypothetical protein [Mariniflexile sp. KMM 9835]
MTITLSVVLIVVLTVVLYQDIMNRTIHITLPVSLFLIAMSINFISIDLDFYNILYNIAFVLINILGLTLYFSFKNKVFINPIDTFIGLGDIVFFIAITPLFTLKPFILFFIIGLLFSLLVHGVYSIFKNGKTIPLAGYLALFLMINVVAKSIFKINVLF